MNYTAVGLFLDIAGVVILGWVVPRHSVRRFDGGPVRPEGIGRLWYHSPA